MINTQACAFFVSFKILIWIVNLVALWNSKNGLFRLLSNYKFSVCLKILIALKCGLYALKPIICALRPPSRIYSQYSIHLSDSFDLHARLLHYWFLHSIVNLLLGCLFSKKKQSRAHSCSHSKSLSFYRLNPHLIQ